MVQKRLLLQHDFTSSGRYYLHRGFERFLDPFLKQVPEPLYDSIAMTSQELIRSTGLTRGKVGILIESGLLEPVEPAAGTGHRLEFAADQLERALLIRELRRKGVTLGQLTGRNLAFQESERFVVFDGNQLRACRDAETAIAAVVRAKRWVSAVDLAAIRSARCGITSPAAPPA